MLGLDTLVAQAFDRDDLHDARHFLVNSIVMTLVLTPVLLSVVSVMPALMLRVGVKSETVATMGAVPARMRTSRARPHIAGWSRADCVHTCMTERVLRQPLAAVVRFGYISVPNEFCVQITRVVGLFEWKPKIIHRKDIFQSHWFTHRTGAKDFSTPLVEYRDTHSARDLAQACFRSSPVNRESEVIGSAAGPVNPVPIA